MEPPGPRHENESVQPAHHCSTNTQSKQKSTPKRRNAPSPHDLPENFALELPDFGGVFECQLDRRQMLVGVATAARPHAAAIDRLAACTGELEFCDQIVVSVPKTHVAFADWMRQLLYAGFQVLSKKSSWSVTATPGSVSCVLDVTDISSSSNSDSYESSVMTDDGESDADSVASDDSWLDGDDDA